MLSSVAIDSEGHIDSFEDLCEFGADVVHNGDNHLAAEFILQNSVADVIRFETRLICWGWGLIDVCTCRGY